MYKRQPSGHLTSVGLEIVTVQSRDEREIYGRAMPPGRWVYSRHDDRFTDVMLMSNATQGSTTFHTVQIQRRPEGNGLFASLAYSTGSTQDLNSGTWDNAYDQWRYNPAVQPNEPMLNYSAFDRSHRISAALAYQFEWSPGYATTVGMLYSGISGTPYSYVYDGDINGDGESLNDLFFIPGQATDVILHGGGDQMMLYTNPTFNALCKFIAEDEYLSRHRRQVAGLVLSGGSSAEGTSKATAVMDKKSSSAVGTWRHSCPGGSGGRMAVPPKLLSVRRLRAVGVFRQRNRRVANRTTQANWARHPGRGPPRSLR